MKRVTLYIIISVSIIITLLTLWQEWFAIIRDRENAIATFILTSLELLGIFLAIFTIYQYIQYRRPRRFIFEGFSNSSEFATSQQKPVDLSNLAREELALQFQYIYRILQEYADRWLTRVTHKSASTGDCDSTCGCSDNDSGTALLAEDDLYNEEDAGKACIEWYLPTIGRSKHDLNNKIYTSSMKQIGNIMRSFENQSNIAGMANVVGGAAPNEIGLILRIFDTLIPPRIVKAIGHLQHRDDPFDRVGITLEMIDLGGHQSSVIRTIWQPRKASVAKKSLTARYIALLRPAMRWLVLVFWEQKLASRLKSAHFNGEFLTRDQMYARVLYLLGSLYSFSASQFPSLNQFFNKIAVDHFEQASQKDSQWCLPYNYLASVYRTAMRTATNETHDVLVTIPLCFQVSLAIRKIPLVNRVV